MIEDTRERDKLKEETTNTEETPQTPEENTELTNEGNENNGENIETPNTDNNEDQNENIEETEENTEKPKEEAPKENGTSKNILEDIVPIPDKEEQKEMHIPENITKLKKEVEAASKKVQNKELNVEEYFVITNKYLDAIATMDNENQQNKLIKELRSNVENTRIEPTLFIGGIDVENYKSKVYSDYTMEILEYKDESRNIIVHFAKSREKDLRYEYPSFLIHLTWIPLLLGIFLLKFTINYFTNRDKKEDRWLYEKTFKI